MTIFSGLNSSGKSSFIQLLLLLKQTIEINSANHQLFLQGSLYKIRDYLDIIFERDLKNKLKIVFEFTGDEDKQIDSPKRITLFDKQSFIIRIEIIFSYYNNVYISEFHVNYIFPNSDRKEQYIKFYTLENEGKFSYKVETNNALFSKELYSSNELKVTDIKYLSLYPDYIEVKLNDSIQKFEERYLVNLDGIRDLLNTTINNIFYIGPARKEPQDEYIIKGSNTSVGTAGEHVAQILQYYANEPIDYYKPDVNENNILTYTLTKSTLLEAVKVWMCDVFEIGENIYSEIINDNYVIYIVSKTGIKTTIRHVGFGISQVLPIIVQGLIQNKRSILILEQPEIHLHPKIQSYIFDFLYSLSINEKNIIVETHSDHFITRMRRRVAEDISNSMGKTINMTFVENVNKNILFRNIEVSNFGTIDFFPKNFIDQSSTEMKAILNAQIIKQLPIKNEF
jgi:predicted ATPase